MIIIPGINCEEVDDVRSRIQQASEFLSTTHSGYPKWIHLDIADGSFTNGYTTWRNSSDIASLAVPKDVHIEAHVMVKRPEEIIGEWVNSGVHRVIVHLSATEHLEAIVSICKERQVALMLALEPEVPVEHAFPYLAGVNACQLLAVTPGKSGQMLDPQTFERIKAIKRRFPSLPLEVDGGIDPLTARACKEAGADMVVSSSYIFTSNDALRAFQELSGI